MSDIENFRSKIQAAGILAQSGDMDAQRFLEQQFHATTGNRAKRDELHEAFSSGMSGDTGHFGEKK